MLENLSTTTKKIIVYTAIVVVVILKIIGVFKSSRLPWYLLVSLGLIAVVTDASPVAAGTLEGRTAGAQ